MTKIIKLIKSPIFAIVINILSLLSTILCLIFVSVEYAGLLFLVSSILFIIFLIVNIYPQIARIYPHNDSAELHSVPTKIAFTQNVRNNNIWTL
jgi:hypothetical protein